jgi:hypothetical protein
MIHHEAKFLSSSKSVKDRLGVSKTSIEYTFPLKKKNSHFKRRQV